MATARSNLLTIGRFSKSVILLSKRIYLYHSYSTTTEFIETPAVALEFLLLGRYFYTEPIAYRLITSFRTGEISSV